MITAVRRLLAAASPEPTSTEEVQDRTAEAASWIGENWQDWLQGLGQILLIVLGAMLLRYLVQRLISKVIQQAVRGARSASSAPARPVLGPGMGLQLANALLVSGERRRQRSEAIGSVLRSVASFTIMAICALTVLSVLNINVAPLLASAGVAGVAIGFGARNLVTDFLSGVFMILEDQYGVGDVVDAGVASGEVIEVGLRVTKLRGDEGEIWYVRNGEIKRIGNMSQGWSTASVDFLVGYREDLVEVRKIAVDAAVGLGADEPWNEYLWEPVELLGVTAVTAESVTLQLQAKTMPGKALKVERELRARLKEALDLAGIRMSTPLVAVDGVGAVLAPAVDVAAPSALNNPASPQYRASQPLVPAGAVPAPAGSPQLGKPENPN